MDNLSRKGKDAAPGFFRDYLINRYQPYINYQGQFKFPEVGGMVQGASPTCSKTIISTSLTVRTDTSVHFSQNAPYAFQTLVTPLRGFPQNSLYGNQYALLNVDVYFPLFQALLPIETNFSSVNNLQLGLFSDLAYARESWQANITGRSKVAYGFSVRTLLAGYSIRADMALPNDSGRKLGWYLSVGL